MAQRNISLDVNGACPVNAFKGLLKRIEEMEKDYELGRTVADVDSVGGDPAVRIVVTGVHYSEVYVFDIIDRVMGTGTYIVDFVQAGV